MRVFFDQMLLIELATGPVSGGKIGYIYRDVEPVFRYTAYSNDAFGSSDRRVPKPVPGTIEAVHFGEEDSGSDSLRGHLSGQPQVIEAGDGTYAVAHAAGGCAHLHDQRRKGRPLRRRRSSKRR